MRRIALITESSARPDQAMPAFLFYQGTHSRWIKSIIQYMSAREFLSSDIFFLSPYGQRIIGYEEVVTPYPKQKYHPRKREAAQLANKVVDFVLKMDPLPFVEIHAGRTLADPLKQQFDENGISSRVYGDGIPLGTKPTYYENLIEEELDKRKLKQIQREKWDVTSMVRYQTPQEASEIVNRYGKRAQLYGIEKNVEELKRLLGDFHQKRKEEKKALRELKSVMTEEDLSGELTTFLESQKSLADLYANQNLDNIKNKFGRSIAKLTLYLIKRNYVILMENKISEALLRTQIALLKS
ncbi:hypothetical protein P4K96_30645 [Bacillus cereus]|nr:hypothetical protein [Bacillus cereus]